MVFLDSPKFYSIVYQLFRCGLVTFLYEFGSCLDRVLVIVSYEASNHINAEGIYSTFLQKISF